MLPQWRRMPPKNQQLPQQKQQKPHTSYNHLRLHELRCSAKRVITEYHCVIVTNAASEHVNIVSIGAPYASGCAAMIAKIRTGANIL